jgi:hypothetical protein
VERYLIWLDEQPSGYTVGAALAPTDHRVAVKVGEVWSFITPALTERDVDTWYTRRLERPEPVTADVAAWLDEAVRLLRGRRSVEHVLGGVITGALAAS